MRQQLQSFLNKLRDLGFDISYQTNVEKTFRLSNIKEYIDTHLYKENIILPEIFGK